MFSTEDFSKNMERLKKENGKLFSNTMLMGAELERLACHNCTQLIVRSSEMFIIEPDDGFSHVYFVVPAENAAGSLKSFVSGYHGRKLVFDLVGRTKGVTAMVEKLAALGLEPYAEYNRYVLHRRKTSEGFYRNICYSPDITYGFAKEEGTDRISEIFTDVFDRYTSHIPFSAEEVSQHIAKGEICCAYYKGRIAAAFCFERLDEKNIHLNVVASVHEYDSLGIGMLLYEYVLDLFLEDTSFVCWIEKNNSASINMHDSFGFIKDKKMLFYFYTV